MRLHVVSVLAVCSWLALGVSGSAHAAEGRVSFVVEDSDRVDFVRVYVGLSPRDYEVTVDLRGARIGAMGRAMASDPQLARVLSEPKLYFVALTAVDAAGRESGFSNELQLDLRGCPGGGCPAGMVPRPGAMSPGGGGDQPPARPGGGASGPAGPGGSPATPARPGMSPSVGGVIQPAPVPGAPVVSVRANGAPLTGEVRVASGVPLRLVAQASDPDGLGFPVFRALGDNKPVSFIWDFAGGQPDSPEAALSAAPTVRFFLQAGERERRVQLRLVVVDTKGTQAQVLVPVRVVSVGPPELMVRVDGTTVAQGRRVIVRPGTPVQFLAVATDPDGLGFPALQASGIDTPISYVWDFGGGTPGNVLAPFAPNPFVTFDLAQGSVAATFNVRVTVIDTMGAMTTREIPVDVVR